MVRTVRCVAAIVVATGALACGGKVEIDVDPPDAAPPPAPLCAAKHLGPWTRGQVGVGGAVTFNELMYHPVGVGGIEWIELYNPLAFDFDLSGFRIDGAVHLTFAADTRIPPGGTVVVASSAAMAGAVGVFTGQLPDDVGTVELWNNAGRLLDVVSYRDDAPWPVRADGAGATLAKRTADRGSELAEAWTASAVVGGTPGAANLAAAGGVGPDVPTGLAFHEIAGAGDDLWVELINRGGEPIDVGGAVVHAARGGDHTLAARALAPGELLLLDRAALGFGAVAGEVLTLYPADRATVLDGVRVVEVPRGRAAPAGDWRYPDVATPGAANAFVAHDGEVVIDELMYHPPPVAAADGTVTPAALEWIELHVPGAAPVDVGGWQLVDAVAYELPAGTVIPAGGYLVVASDVAAFAAAYPGVAATVVGDFAGGLADGGDHVVLRDGCANPVDAVRYADGGRWPTEPDGGGASLELRSPAADHGAGEAWAASDESARAGWQTVSYEGVAAASAVGPDGVWQELVIGLLDAGVVLIDDVSVTVDPATAPTELVTGGDFESGGAAFRLRGNHRHGEVVVDPGDAGNHVLRLVATGPTEHMHNHVETTLALGHRITNGRTYRISLRARWQAGSGLINTRLYFNRLARTTALAVPTAPGTPGAINSRAVANLGPTYRDLRHAPAVPQPGQPVEVSVVAADPDGVAGLTLWYAADGGPFESLPMTAAGDRFVATVPGRAAASVVQFYVEGRDARAATSTFPAAGAGSRALWKVDDGLAATTGLHNLRIVMTPADATWLFDARNIMSNDLVGATVIVDEREATYDVGVRLKGSERGRPTTARIGFGLAFPADRPFRGALRTVLLDRSQGVGYGQREVFYFQAMNRAGAVPSQYDDLVKVLPPRADLASAAHLQLARFSGPMLTGQFDRGDDGDLFEYELIYYPTTTADGTPTGAKLPQPDSVVGTGVRDLGADEEAYRYDFIIKANRWRDDYRGLIRFAKAFGQTGAAFDAQVGDVIDVDQWLRAFAFATLSGAVDNYGSGAAHNAEFYLRPGDGRTLYFPHDLDFLGGPTGPVVGSGDLARLMAVPARARAYYGHLHDIIATGFNTAYMTHWSQQMGALLPGQDFAGHLRYVTDRAAWVMTGAPNAITRAIPPVGFQITTNGGAALTVTAATVDLDGQGWVDVRQIVRAGAALPLTLTWPTTSTWRATLPVACGAQTIALDALDPRGQSVGSDAIDVTRTGADCP